MHEQRFQSNDESALVVDDIVQRGGRVDEETDAPVEDVSKGKLEKLQRQIERQDLPVREALPLLEEKIAASLDGSGVFFLQGETGSGKSIYAVQAIQKVLRERGLPDKIIMLQPTRDAARGIAEAQAAVTGGVLGRDVGYSTSEMKAVDRDTPVHIVTSGILPRYLFNKTVDKSNTGAIVLDEVHVGSLDYHYVFGLLKELQSKEEAPLVVLMTATPRKEEFQRFFEFQDEDFLRVEGRTYPVEKQYLEPKAVEYGYGKEYLGDVKAAVQAALASEREGDILVFLPTVADINECIREFKDSEEYEAIPLHGGLSFDDRNKALSGERAPGVKRRVVFATNVAESAVTVPNITQVIDSCREKVVYFDHKAGIFRNRIRLISKASAEQRAGRAGRMESGRAQRLVTEAEFRDMPEQSETEIELTSLAHLILRLKGYGYDPETFPYFVRPKKEDLHSGVERLKVLGALDASGEITDVGREMLDLPFRPEDARMLVEAKKLGCESAAILLATLGREQLYAHPTPAEIDAAPGWDEASKRIAARKKIAEEQQQFEYGNSDWHKMIRIFVEAVREGGVFECLGDRNQPRVKHAFEQFAEWCRLYHLNPMTLRHVAARLYEYSRAAGVEFDREQFIGELLETQPEAVEMAIITGYQERLLMHNRGSRSRLPDYWKVYGRSMGEEIVLSPASVTFARPPEFCVAKDLGQGGGKGSWGMNVTRTYAKEIQPVTLEQALAVLGDRAEAQFTEEPRYSRNSDRVVQRIGYRLKPGFGGSSLGEIEKPIDGIEGARLLAEAIVREEAELSCHAENLETIDELRELSQRSRGRIAMPNLTEWYTKRLGTVASLDAAEAMGDRLRLRVEDICPPELRREIDQDYPETISLGELSFPIQYTYRAADARFGVSEYFQARVDVPPNFIDQVEGGSRVLVGGEGNRVPVMLQTTIAGRVYRAESIDALRSEIGLMDGVSLSVVEEMKGIEQEVSRLQEAIFGRQYEFNPAEQHAYAERLSAITALLKISANDGESAAQRVRDAQRAIDQIEDDLETRSREVSDRRESEKAELRDRYERLRARYLGRRERIDDSQRSVLEDLQVELDAYFGLGWGISRTDGLRPIGDIRAQIEQFEQGLDSAEAGVETALSRAFRGATAPRRGNDVAKGETAAPIIPKKVVPAEKQETELSSEERERLLVEVDFLEASFGRMLALARENELKRVTKTPTSAEKAAKKILDRKNVLDDIRSLRREVRSGTDPNVIRGHVTDMTRSVESLRSATMNSFIPGYVKQVWQRFGEMWREIPRAIQANEDAQAAIEMGMVTFDRLVADVRREVEKHIPDFETGNDTGMVLSDVIKNVVDEY